MSKGLFIEAIEQGSLAEEAGLGPGDRLLAINGHQMRDVIDFWFHSGDEELILEVAKACGETWEIEAIREEGIPMGMRFRAPAPRRCGNACLFCFVDQLPKGLRRTLYVKDEDYRLSFLYGNFVTLSALRKNELRRILEQRLSPLYVSVHATEPELRRELLGNPAAPPLLDILKELTGGGITIHAQVVLCPGLNDGIHLERTVEDLAAMHPGVTSLAVVPVGLTRHREFLPRLQPVTREYAAVFIAEWQQRSAAIARELGAPFLFLADEFYLKAGLPFPPISEYGDLPQVENGVGMIPIFMAESDEVIAGAERLGPAAVTIVTGESPYAYLERFVADLSRKTGVCLKLASIRNDLFGGEVTVAGLVSGRDICAQLKGSELGRQVMIPDVMLRECDGLFLDDVTTEYLEKELGIPVSVFKATPKGLYAALKRLLQS
ncbi:MAG: DUF512 domain-containing protein [Geobacteraceae bacterium]|nr:DUF512 domain-containing protein [Geobacteraceae bacterium]